MNQPSLIAVARVVVALSLFICYSRAQETTEAEWKNVGSKLIVGTPRSSIVDSTTVRVGLSHDGTRLVVFRIEREDNGQGNYTGRVLSYEWSRKVSSPPDTNTSQNNGTTSSMDQGGDWMETARMDFPPNPFFIRPFLAVSGNATRFVVGGDDVPGYEPRVYEWNTSQRIWQPLGRQQPIGGSFQGGGTSLEGVAMNQDGSRIAIAYGKRMRVFDYDSGSQDWAQQGRLLSFGSDLADGVRCVDFSWSGNRMVVGLYSEEALVLDYDPTRQSWSLVMSVLFRKEGSFPSSVTWFGYDCAMSATGEQIAVGAPKGGLVRIFDENADSTSVNTESGIQAWGIIGEITATGHQPGNSVALSAAGDRVAVAMGMADYIQVYSQNQDTTNRTWTPTGQPIPCVYRALFGPGVVALSSDGNRVVAGQSNTVGGHVDVLQCVGCPPSQTLAPAQQITGPPISAPPVVDHSSSAFRGAGITTSRQTMVAVLLSLALILSCF